MDTQTLAREVRYHWCSFDSKLVILGSKAHQGNVSNSIV